MKNILFFFCLLSVYQLDAQRLSDSLNFDFVSSQLEGKSNYVKYYSEQDSVWYIYFTSSNDGPQISAGQISKKIKKEGDYFEFDHQKQIVIYGNYEKNKEDGLFLYFGKDRRVIRSTHFEKGKMDGPAKNYYSNGQLRLSTDYKKGLKHGDMLGFYMDGMKLYTGKYKKDKMIGLRMYYDVKGRPANGDMTWRHENGAVKLTGKCINGKPDGRFSHYDEKGELTLQVDYTMGLADGAYIKYENGKVEFKECYHLGKITGRPCH